MRTMLSAFLGLGLVALLSRPRRRARQAEASVAAAAMAVLLGNESVQKELKLDDKQIEKAKELAEKTGEEMREKIQGLQDLSPEERRAKMHGDQSRDQRVDPQGGRRVPQARADHSPQADLLPAARGAGLQRPRGRQEAEPDRRPEDRHPDDRTEAMQEMRTIFQENQDDREAAMKKMHELNKKTLTKVEAKLNDEQQKTWKEMLGAPFEVKYEQN